MEAQTPRIIKAWLDGVLKASEPGLLPLDIQSELIARVKALEDEPSSGDRIAHDGLSKLRRELFPNDYSRGSWMTMKATDGWSP